MNCKNCDQTVSENFCPRCGQNTNVEKITLPNFLNDLSGSIFQIDRGFFFSIKELFLRPGHSIKEYINGKRKNHFKPVAYALTLSTIYFLLSQLVESNTFINDAITGFSNVSNGSEIDSRQLETLTWFAENYAYSMLLLLPMYTLVSYVAFLGSGFNYLEHFVLNAYITGQQAILYSISSILSLFTDSVDILASFTLLISVSYAFFVFLQFFSEQSRLTVIMRSILSYVLYFVMLPLVLFIILFATY